MTTTAAENAADELTKLRKEFGDYKLQHSLQNEELLFSRKEILKYQERVSTLEQENESLRRISDRANQENDQLLEKFDSVSRAARILQDNESMLQDEIKLLKEENRSLKQSVRDCNEARDNVIEKLKEVSIETRELIDNCEKSAEESKIFKIKCDELEEELAKLKQSNESTEQECQRLQCELRRRDVEMDALNEKVSSHSGHLVDDILKSWNNDIPLANCSLQTIEIQLKKLIDRLNETESFRMQLKDEVERLKRSNSIFQEQNTLKDEIICKQNLDFVNVKNTVDEYHSEILRLDSELKDCHKRVSALNENLETINSENVDLAEYALFRQSLEKFGALENIENLLAKLQVLQEIEQFFENKLAPHVDPSRDPDDSDPIVACSKENTINKIKNYLEKALVTIEKLNDKMLRLRNEYEVKLRTKNAEISTLRDLMLSATMYNRILERSLQQFRDNLQLDNTIENKTNELLTVNASLIDSFEELKQVYQTNDRCNCFLFAKMKQLKLFCRILQLSIDRKGLLEAHFEGLFGCVNEIFDEVEASEFRYKLSQGSETLMSLCERKVTTNHYLKNMVENMSLEVKRLTSKVELEMTEKIQEIEMLKGEVDTVKTDNCDLVNKIKNCNREIVCLSTDNYDLNEKLENLAKVEQECESLRRELTFLRAESEKLRHFAPVEEECESVRRESPDFQAKSGCDSGLAAKTGSLFDVCRRLKTENQTLRENMSEFASSFNNVVLEIAKTVPEATSKLDFGTLLDNVNGLRAEQQTLKSLAGDMNERLREDIELLKNADEKAKRSLREQLIKVHASCAELREQSRSIELTDLKNSLNDTISVVKSEFVEKFAAIGANYDALIADLDEARSRTVNENDILTHGTRLKSNLAHLKTLNASLHVFVEELPAEFSKCVMPLIDELKTAVSSTVENLKISFASSNEEIIKEMQEMNSELKKRSSTISTLNQTLNDLEKEKHQILEKLREKENVVCEMLEFKKKSQESEQEMQTVRQSLEQKYDEELRAKEKCVENLSTELENLKGQLSTKDDIIASLEHEISKQREGDASSMGTFSRTEEVSRLNDVEDSFEERYLKLRCLAVKMKKNIAELTVELKTEKTERAALLNKLQSVSEQAKRAHILQEECDKLNDELEIRQNEIRELKRIIMDSDKENENLKLRCSEVTNNTVSSKTEITYSKTEKNGLEIKLNTLTDELEKLSSEKLCEEIIKKEREREISSLKEKLKQNEESKKKLQNELEQAKLEARKQGALTLEMQDYEKTISDLTNKIKNKENVILQITEKLNDSLLQNDALVNQVKQLEEQIQSYLSNIQTADEEIINLNKIIVNHENEAEKSEQRLRQTIQQLESERAKNESVTLQLANSSAELKTLTESCRIKEKQLSDQTKSLQERLSQTEEKLRIRESEFKKLKDDFEAYKVRAHNVLQKCKAENNSKNTQEKLQTEISSLSSTLNTLRKELDDTLNEMDNQKAEINLLKSTKENLTGKVKELSETVAEKSKEIDSLLAERKSFKLNTDTLINCYKVEIEKLKSLNEELKSTNAQIRNTEPSKPSENANYAKTRTEDYSEGDFPADDRSLHNSSCDMPESEIEAIEETERYRKSSKHSLIPLDKLLERDLNESRTFDLNEAELRKHVESLEQQVKYLTSILNESEKNSARSEQQVTFLKDEIRRLERMFEREPHLQNTEYVKNVIFKFITLPCGDERHRLITVLETILKLTPNERQMLTAVAKGDRLDAKQAGGWTSFLGWS